jgi:hypothetical protein
LDSEGIAPPYYQIPRFQADSFQISTKSRKSERNLGNMGRNLGNLGKIWVKPGNLGNITKIWATESRKPEEILEIWADSIERGNFAEIYKKSG